MENGSSNVFTKLPLMTREEWHKTSDFIILRFLNNMTADVGHKIQEIRDILELMLSHRPELVFFDRFAVVERQLQVVSLEAKRLWDECRKLDTFLSPKNFSDINFTPANTDSSCINQPVQNPDLSSVPSQDS